MTVVVKQSLKDWSNGKNCSKTDEMKQLRDLLLTSGRNKSESIAAQDVYEEIELDISSTTSLQSFILKAKALGKKVKISKKIIVQIIDK